MAWTLNGSTSVKDSGGNSIIATKSAGGDDSCSVTLAIDADTDLSGDFSEEDSITVENGSYKLFKGVIARIAPDASGSRESITLEIESPWYWLERIVFQQRYATGDADTFKYKSRVTLGVDEGGDRLNGEDAIRAILDYANAEGAGLAGDSITLGDVFFPPIDMQDATCAECVRQILRYFPDAVVFWDHSTGILNIKRGFGGLGSAISAASSGDGSGVTNVSLMPRQDRKIRGVVIHYEITETIDGTEYVQVQDDAAGATSGKNVVIFTIPLTGNQTTIQSQQITAQDIPTSAGAVDADWLTSHFEEIAACSPSSGQVEVVSISQAIDGEDAVDGLRNRDNLHLAG